MNDSSHFCPFFPFPVSGTTTIIFSLDHVSINNSINNSMNNSMNNNTSLSSSSDGGDTNSVQNIKDRSNKKRKKKHKKKRHRESDDHHGGRSKHDSRIDKKRRKKVKHKHKHRHRSEKRKDDKYYDESDSGADNDTSDSDIDSDSDSDSVSDHSYQRRKKKRKKKRSKKSRHDDDRKRRHEKQKQTKSSSTQNTSTASSKYNNILPQLHNLLSNHPNLAAELPYLLIKMCSGSSINLSQIPDPSLSVMLREVFITLGCTMVRNGEYMFDDNGQWKNSSRGDSDGRALVLVKLIRFLLNDNGLTMDTIQQFELKQQEQKDQINDNERRTLETASASASASVHQGKTETHNQKQDATSSLITMLLDTFQPKQQSQSSSLAQELISIMDMILDGEIICLDGLEDESLRLAIEKLFTIIGLVREEMEDDDDDDNSGNVEESANDQNTNRKEVSYGYILPSTVDEDNTNNIMEQTTKQKLITSIDATKTYHLQFLEQQQANVKKRKRKTIGPTLPSNVSTSTYPCDNKEGNDNDSDDDGDGPAPFGSQMAKARSMKGPVIPIHQNLLEDPTKGKREEWMMVPGEHDFLKGVMSSGTIKSRKFKNEKSGNSAPMEAPMNPEIKREVDSIVNAHQAARGPSLVEQHRERIAEEKAAKALGSAKGKKGSDWNWSKDDLDSGRRVDKNYLHMVMGGATTELKSKFQGSLSNGFT